MTNKFKYKRAFSQSRMIEQIIKYLKLQHSINPKEYTKENVDVIIKKAVGFCHGLSIIWSYLHSIDQEELFGETLQLIDKWNGTLDDITIEKIDDELGDGNVILNKNSLYHFGKSLKYNKNKLISAFESFISKISLLQGGEASYNENNYSDQEFINYIEMILPAKKDENKTFIDYIGIDAPLYKDEIVNILKTFLKKDRILVISDKAHSMSIVKKNNKYIFYDSNDVKYTEGRNSPGIIVDTIGEAVDLLITKQNELELNKTYPTKFFCASKSKFEISSLDLIKKITEDRKRKKREAPKFELVDAVFQNDFEQVKFLVEALGIQPTPHEFIYSIQHNSDSKIANYIFDSISKKNDLFFIDHRICCLVSSSY